MELYPWAKSLCLKHDWYKIDPHFQAHKCQAKCKMCKQIFYTGRTSNDDEWDGMGTHFFKCPLRIEMIEKYQLRGY